MLKVTLKNYIKRTNVQINSYKLGVKEMRDNKMRQGVVS